MALFAGFGIILMIPKFELGNNITQGVLWGMTSGFGFALVSILNKKYIKKYASLTIAFYQSLGVVLLFIPFISQEIMHFTFKDMLFLFLLGVVCTGMAHALFIKSLTNIKVQLASVIESSASNIYAIIFAILLLQEMPNFRVMLGGIIILGTTIYASSQIQTKNPGVYK